MKILFTSVHRFNPTSEIYEKFEVPVNDDLQSYIIQLVNDIKRGESNRRFKFISETTEVRIAIDKYINTEYENASEILSHRLSEKEKEAQQEYIHLTEIQRGVLFQAYIEEVEKESTSQIIIIKADHNDFLDEYDFQTHTGLPIEKKIFKAILIEFDQEKNLSMIKVFDTNRSMTKYWWKEFLELKEEYTDEYNSKTSFTKVDSFLTKSVKRKSSIDYYILRNSVIHYFRTKEEFNLNEFAQNIFGDYTPINPELDVKKIEGDVLLLGEKEVIDRRFSIVRSEITAKFKKTIQLNPNIDLILKADIENITDVIRPHIGNDGVKYLQIRTDEGFDLFNGDINE